MTQPEWSPNEGYLRKLERLAFALVRTRPSREPREKKKKNLWIDKSKGLAGPFAVALLIGIPYVAQNSTGPIIVASLLLAAVDACLAAWCYSDFECQHGHCSGDLFKCVFNCVGEFPAFLVGWWRIQAFSAGFAACARTLSSIMDSVTGRHIDKFMENTLALGGFTPMGAPLDFLAVGVTAVPTLMCAIGMEASGFLRFCLYLLTSFTTLTIFSSALASSHLAQINPAEANSEISDRNIYAKIITGTSLASIGFLGLYKICKPDNLTLKQHQHFQVNKRFSLTGCVISSAAFLFYFLESTVLNKVQPNSVWDGDPPLLWPLDGGWRIGVAALGIASLALATFEFLIPMCVAVTKLANDGLLYRNLRKDEHDLEETKWNVVTPLVFGFITALEACLIDTKVLLSLVSSSLMCIHIVVGASMLASRYQVRTCPSPHRKIYHSRTRPRNRATPNQPTAGQARRLMTVSFLKSGMSKIPREMMDELDASRVAGTSRMGANSDRTYLMDDVSIAPIEPRGSTEFSIGSRVSGYESDSDPDMYQSDNANETDIDAAVTDYQERIRVATLNGAMPMSPTQATARRVSFTTMALVPCCLALAASLNRAPRGHLTGIMLAVSSGLLTFLLLVVISRQPQKRRQEKSTHGPNGSATVKTPPISNFFNYSIIPWAPAGAIFLHSCLLLEGLDMSAFPFAFWLSTGLIIYFSYGVSKSIAAPASLVIPTERVRLTGSGSGAAAGGNGPSTSTSALSGSQNNESYVQVDTVVIS